MKQKKSTIRLVSAIVLLAFVMLVVQSLFNIPPLFIALLCLSLGFVSQPEMRLFAGLYPEVYSREIIKRFNTADQATWRNGIPDKSSGMTMTQDGETVVINSVFFGVRPDVLINNNTYPIPIQDLTATNFPIAVHKFQTKATPITDDEQRGLSFNKIKESQEAHAVSIEEEKNSMGLHSLAPVSNSSDLPVLKTTGDIDNGRRMMIKKDILTFRAKWLNLVKVMPGSRLVLSPEHVSDLLAQDQKFADQYYNYTTGKIANLYGFEIFEDIYAPWYNVSTLGKVAYGAVPGAGTAMASTAFHLRAVGQAKGFTKAYLSASKDDPQYQRTLLNYRHYDIILRVAPTGTGAIVSDLE